MTLKDFPRGGKKTITRVPSNFLFDKKQKIRYKKTKSKKVEVEQLHVEESIVPNIAKCLTYSSLMEGMIVLGRIRTSTEYDVLISLPGRLLGYLPVTNISQAYTNLLQNLVQHENNRPTEFKPLNELCKHGDYLVCYVKRVNFDEKYRIILSIEPELINQNLDPEKLRKGSKIVCSISSIEDHGYVVDTGMKVLRGFLSNKDIDDNVQYYPGQQIFCTIKCLKSIENVTTVKMSMKSKHTTSIAAFDEQSLCALIPGMFITLNIKNILPNGLQVIFNTNNIGYINQLYLNKPLSFYERSTNIVGKLLYVLPTVKLAYFAESSLIEKKSKNETVEIGSIIEDAKFLYRESNGIMLLLMQGARGFVSFKRTGIDFDAIPSKFFPNSVHKCCVLAYDIFDEVFICTMERHKLNDKFGVPQHVNAGDVMTVEIIRINNENGFIFVKCGNIHGDVVPEHAADIGSGSREKPQINAKMKARVLGQNKEGNGLLFTLKKSLVDSKLPILSNINDATIGSKFNGTIARIDKHGLLVVFFNNVKGWIPSINLKKKTGGTLDYSIGQVVLVKINKVNSKKGKLWLSMVNDTVKVNEDIKFEIGETVEGVVIESTIDGAYLEVSRDNNSGSVIGYLPAGHMAPCAEIATHLLARCVPGDKISALVFSTFPDFLLTQTIVPQEKYTNLNKLQIGNCIPGSIREINNRTGLKVVLPIKEFESYGTVPLNKIDNIEIMFRHQVVFGIITNINKKEKKINLSIALTDVWSDAVKHQVHMLGAVDQLTLYLSKLKELSSQPYYKSKAISSISLGERVSGVVDKVTDHGLVLRLNDDVTGTVRLAHYKDTFEVGDEVKGTVLWINFIHELVEVTLLPMLANAISEKQAQLPQISLETQLRGEVVLVTNWFVLVVLKGQGKGTLATLPSRRHVNDLEPNLKMYTIGKKIRCYVVLNKNESEIVPVCLIKSAFELKTKIVLNERNEMKRKIDDFKADDSLLIKKLKRPAIVIGKNKIQVNKKPMKSEEFMRANNKLERKREETRLKVEEEQNEIDCVIENEKVKNLSASLSIPECGFFWDTKHNMELVENEKSSSESSGEGENDDELQQRQKKEKKLSATERREMERQKEREIREREQVLITNEIPNSVDQFDRLVLASPDSSIIWLQYMAYHLQATELDKARAVAKRALETINFREQNEKLNVWQAWLNLESRFGTPENLNDIFQLAVNANESKNIYLHMLTVYADAGRHIELEKMVNTVTGKFKQLPQMWIEVGTALLKMGLKDKSRHIMQRALQSLPPQEHVNLMVKFAQLENKFGDKERAQTLFEQILSSYPKRIDVWLTYVDCLVKCGKIDAARQILNKAVVQSLPPRKMRTLFKKFIDFEEQYGTPESRIHTRELAVAYVEKQCSNEVN